jgi:hypothetical protein
VVKLGGGLDIPSSRMVAVVGVIVTQAQKIGPVRGFTLYRTGRR